MGICLTHGYYPECGVGPSNCPVCVTEAMNSEPVILNRVELPCPTCAALRARVALLEKVAESAAIVARDAVVTIYPGQPALTASVDHMKWGKMIDALIGYNAALQAAKEGS